MIMCLAPRPAPALPSAIVAALPSLSIATGRPSGSRTLSEWQVSCGMFTDRSPTRRAGRSSTGIRIRPRRPLVDELADRGRARRGSRPPIRAASATAVRGDRPAGRRRRRGPSSLRGRHRSCWAIACTGIGVLPFPVGWPPGPTSPTGSIEVEGPGLPPTRPAPSPRGPRGPRGQPPAETPLAAGAPGAASRSSSLPVLVWAPCSYFQFRGWGEGREQAAERERRQTLTPASASPTRTSSWSAPATREPSGREVRRTAATRSRSSATDTRTPHRASVDPARPPVEIPGAGTSKINAAM